MGENGKRISTLLSELTNRNIICTRSYAMKLKGLATGVRGDSLIQGICRCVWCKWFGVWAHLFWNLLWIVAIAVWRGAQLGLGMALKNEMGASIVILKPSSERLTLERPV